MAKECLCQANEVVILPCSGGSNCGQIANRVAVHLTEEGVGSLFCLAGIGAHISGMIESARSAKRLVAIDGCSVECAKKTLEHAGLNITDYIDVTEEGIAKNKNFKLSQQDILFIVKRIKQELRKVK
ncbi:MAG: putative zinc-binding protein [Candidatus Omnitrophica bacterium]|nr:putative zinc-binding protein [Candidatus Omnitrophota bacterium]MCM8791116.1 putative zinc-binding protein [Candidatus Omnitrophota bacterium]